MSNILDLILSLVQTVDSLKRDVDILKNNEKVINDFYNKDEKEEEISNQEDEKWEDFIKNGEKDK